MERSQPQHRQVRDCLEEPPGVPRELKRWPALGYILPFAVFIGFLAVGRYLPLAQPIRFLAVLAVLAIFSRGLLPVRPSRFLASVLLGVAVFFIWIGPDALIPGYRNSILFSNWIVGRPEGSTIPADKISLLFLVFRVLGSVLIVPIVEELFWRGWMMRWIAHKDFTRIPFGTYHKEAFWIVAVLFASEHGSYWDVGLVTGVIYNWWAIRTKNLTDCVIAHAVTNACLAIYVISWNQWQYWL
jgi:CAAX prenyl protease-like protein